MITWAPPAGITYGTALPPLSSTRPPQSRAHLLILLLLGSIPAAGTDTLSVTFTPTDTTNYTTATKTVQLTVSQATPVITWATPAGITYGTALSATQLNATASVPGSFVYTPAAGSIPSAGTDTLSVIFTPTDTANYTTATKTVQLTVSQAAPVITWAPPAGITYGTALSTAQLNATASVPGTFVYTPALGSVPTAGTDTLSVTFTPTDTANYSTVTKTVQLTVSQAVPGHHLGHPGRHHLRHGTLCRPAQCDGFCSRNFCLHPGSGQCPDGRHGYPFCHLYSDGHHQLLHRHQDGTTERRRSDSDDHVVQSCRHHLRNGSFRHAAQRDRFRPWHVRLHSSRGQHPDGRHRYPFGHVYSNRHHQLHNGHRHRAVDRQPGYSDDHLGHPCRHHLRNCPLQCATRRNHHGRRVRSYTRQPRVACSLLAPIPFR